MLQYLLLRYALLYYVKADYEPIGLFLAVPGPPQEVTVADGQRYVTVSWLPPKMSQRNGVITGYVVSQEQTIDCLNYNMTYV